MNTSVTSDGPSSMPDIMEFLRALQFGDSTLPVGAFSFSNGIESAVQQGIVHDLKSLDQFVRSAMQQSATSDGIALLEAHRGALSGDFTRIMAADRAVICRKLNEEMRTMTVRMGRKLAEMAVHINSDLPIVNDWLKSVKQKESPGSYPVAQAIVFAGLQLSEQHAFAVHQYGIASLMLGAVLRVMRISYLDTQSILFEVNRSSTAAYDRIVKLNLDDMSAYAPMMDILAGVHVKSKIRMFMN